MSGLNKSMKLFQVSVALVLITSVGGCASYTINSTDLASFKTNPTAGIPYFLPKLEIEATVTWTILSCAGVSDLTIKTKISETKKYIADSNELYVLDTQKAVGGLLDNALSLTINDEGVLTAFDSKTEGKGTEVTKEIGTLLATLTGSPGIVAPFGAGTPSASCSFIINGKSLSDWSKLKYDYAQELKKIEELEYKSGNFAFTPSSLSAEDLAKVWIDPKKAKARRDYIMQRLAYIEEQTSFTSTVTFDPLAPSIAPITIPDKDIAWASAGTLNSTQIKKLSDESKISVSSTHSSSTIKPSGILKKKNALIYRVPAAVQLTYKLGALDAKTSRHLAPQAGAYAMIPIKSDAFGSVQTKVTFGTNGMIATYGFDSKTGLAGGLGAANQFQTTLEGADNAAIVAETDKIKNILALKEQQKKLKEFDETNPTSNESP